MVNRESAAWIFGGDTDSESPAVTNEDYLQYIIEQTIKSLNTENGE